MAVIALKGTSFDYAMGMGVFDGLSMAFSDAKRTASTLHEALSTLKSKIDVVATAASVDASQTQVQQAKSREDTKKSSLTLAYEKLDALITDTGRVDQRASSKISSREDDFYKRYYYLKPECKKTDKEKRDDWWAECWQNFKNSWNGLCNAVSNIVQSIGDWCKEHWKAIVTVVIVIVAVALICTGVGGPLGAAAIGALIGAGAGGLFGGIMSAATGGSFWEGFENGAFSGAIAGAITGTMGFGFVGNSGVSLSFWQTVATGAVSSGGSSLLSDLGDKFIKGEDISFGDILINTLFSAGTGAALSAVSYGAGKIFTSIKQRIFPSKNIQNAPYIKDGKPNGRPGPTGKAKEEFLNDLYKNQVGKDGILRDPNTGQVLDWKPGDPMKNIVDIGHKTGKEYNKVFPKYQQGKWSLDQLKSFQSNPKNFQLEAASSNRSHFFEGSTLFDTIKGGGFPWINVLSGSIAGGR